MVFDDLQHPLEIIGMIRGQDKLAVGLQFLGHEAQVVLGHQAAFVVPLLGPWIWEQDKDLLQVVVGRLAQPDQSIVRIYKNVIQVIQFKSQEPLLPFITLRM